MMVRNTKMAEDRHKDETDHFHLSEHGKKPTVQGLVEAETLIHARFERILGETSRDNPLSDQLNELYGLMANYFGCSRRFVGGLGQRNRRLLQAQQELEFLCDHDVLSQLLNRRGLTRALEAEIARADRHGVISSFIYFDINGFKHINDHFGHAQGDHVLRNLSDFIQKRLRKTDSFARLGGDEFGIILSHATREQALNKMDSLGRSVALICQSWGPGAGGLSFSTGVSEIRRADTSGEIIERADMNMYARKSEKSEWPGRSYQGVHMFT